mmetsp:Transcript_33901/g.107671  ORF Transcript_33901/g.107671 Transcript_33901/m.107671 type:complete len:197 (-) Transcript_33901:108-698(-)
MQRPAELLLLSLLACTTLSLQGCMLGGNKVHSQCMFQKVNNEVKVTFTCKQVGGGEPHANCRTSPCTVACKTMEDTCYASHKLGRCLNRNRHSCDAEAGCEWARSGKSEASCTPTGCAGLQQAQCEGKPGCEWRWTGELQTFCVHVGLGPALLEAPGGAGGAGAAAANPTPGHAAALEPGHFARLLRRRRIDGVGE